MTFVIIIFIVSAIIWFSAKIVSAIANLVRKMAKAACIFSGVALLVMVVSRAVV